MGKMLTLTASDGFKLSAYRADPAGKPKGGIVVVQEIFGVNKHIQEVCDGFAKDGYVAVAPAVFDRIEPNLNLGYTDADIARGRDVRGKASWDLVLLDVAAAVKEASSAGKVGVVGYCFGGSVAWLAAMRLSGIACAVGYYGAQVAMFKNEKLKAPAILHFGEHDHSIPMADVEATKQAQPEVPVYVYDAGHGFSCDHRASFNKASHELARGRTMAFFKANIG